MRSDVLEWRGREKTERDTCSLHKENPMSLIKDLLRFAAECDAMAEVARDPESKAAWQDFSSRWSRYAKAIESQSAKAQFGRMSRLHRRSRLSSSVEGAA
jgi:hypothetical protein